MWFSKDCLSLDSTVQGRRLHRNPEDEVGAANRVVWGGRHMAGKALKVTPPGEGQRPWRLTQIQNQKVHATAEGSH